MTAPAARTVTRAAHPDLTDYDLIAPQLSGGKDSALTMFLTMEAARAAGVTERVRSYHAALPLLDWPSVDHDGRTWPGVAKLAALQSSAFGPSGGHIEVTRLMPGPDGPPVPHSLLTEMALYGRFPRMGSKYCTKSAKESVVSAAWTPTVKDLKRRLGRPVRILKPQGMRHDESRRRSTLDPYRNIQANSARIVDEWLPALTWTTNAVKEWIQDHPGLRHWTYDSVPGVFDWKGTTRCSCSLCVFASQRDLLIAVGRRPRLGALYAEVEAVRGDTFRPDHRIHDLIHRATAPGAPDPGIVCLDTGSDFDALEAQVRTALARPPRKLVNLAARHEPERACEGCSAVAMPTPPPGAP